ncbi:hypothetical protein B566_EDAN012653, partial [Ephemera danica]
MIKSFNKFSRKMGFTLKFLENVFMTISRNISRNFLLFRKHKIRNLINGFITDILGNSTLDYKAKCVGIIPHIQDCRGVTFCSSSICMCAPGYQGANCQLGCIANWTGDKCE